MKALLNCEKKLEGFHFFLAFHVSFLFCLGIENKKQSIAQYVVIYMV